MNDKQTLLSELHQARLDRLKEICAERGISRNGSVEVLRAKLIADLVLDEWDFSPIKLYNPPDIDFTRRVSGKISPSCDIIDVAESYLSVISGVI